MHTSTAGNAVAAVCAARGWVSCPLAADVGPVLSTITLKTCGALRDFLLLKIESLGRDLLLRFGRHFQFLCMRCMCCAFQAYALRVLVCSRMHC